MTRLLPIFTPAGWRFSWREMARLAALSAVAAAVVGGACPAHAAIPTIATVEGLLTSTGGGTAADGTYQVTFAVYAAETGGTPVWSEGPIALVSKGGQFSYLLGSKTPLSAASLSLQNAWLGVQVGADPELPRRPLGATLYALRAVVAESLDCSGCVKIGALDAGVLQPYAKSSDLAPFAKSADLAAYAKAADLASYAKASDLLGYAKATDLAAYAKSADLADYVKAAALAKVAGTGSYTDLSNTPVLAKVASTGDYADLKNAPAIPAVGKLCGTGLFFKGYNADGSINCVALKETDLPPDGIDDVSNGLIANQFVDFKAGTTDVAIPDGLGAGKTDTLTFDDIGLAQKIWVSMTINNSDLSGVKVELYGPGMANPYVLYDGSKTGTTLTAKFNDDMPIVSGDMNKDWVGKNIKGTWSITVKDVKIGGGAGGFDGKFNWAVNIQTLSSKKVQVKGNVIIDGDVTIGGTLSPKAGGAFRNSAFVRAAGGTTYCAGSYQDITGVKLDYTTRGGNVRITGDVPVYYGSHSALRATIDNKYAGEFGGVGWGYVWQDGLHCTSCPGCGNWTNLHYDKVFSGVPAGAHTFRLQVYTDGACASCGVVVGNGSMHSFMAVEESF